MFWAEQEVKGITLGWQSRSDWSSLKNFSTSEEKQMKHILFLEIDPTVFSAVLQVREGYKFKTQNGSQKLFQNIWLNWAQRDNSGSFKSSPLSRPICMVWELQEKRKRRWQSLFTEIMNKIFFHSWKGNWTHELTSLNAFQ